MVFKLWNVVFSFSFDAIPSNIVPTVFIKLGKSMLLEFVDAELDELEKLDELDILSVFGKMKIIAFSFFQICSRLVLKK